MSSETDRPVPQSGQADRMSSGLWGRIWHFSWPMVMIMLLNFCIGFADVYVAGLIGMEVQAAVGFVNQIFFVVLIIANAISIGAVAIISRLFGSGEFDRAADAARQALLVSIVIALVLSAAGLVFSDAIVAMTGVPPGIRQTAADFLSIFALALGPNYLLILASAVFRACGDMRRPLLVMIVVAGITVAGDFLLAFGFSPVIPALGYRGIAWATALAVTAGMVVSLGMLLEGRLPLRAGPWRIAWPLVGRIMSLGWPAGLVQIAWSAGTLVLYGILGGLGTGSIAAIASLTNGLRIEAIIYLPAFALNMAAAVLIGQSLGAGDAEGAEQTGWRIAGAGLVLVSVPSLVIFVFADAFAALLSPDAAVRHETARYLRFNMVSEPFMALSAILGGGLQGAGDTKGVMRIIVTALWLVRIPLAAALALVFGLGPLGVWIAMVTSMCLQGCFMAVRFRNGAWKQISVDPIVAFEERRTR